MGVKIRCLKLFLLILHNIPLKLTIFVKIYNQNEKNHGKCSPAYVQSFSGEHLPHL